jgi:hypothetical protein
MRMRLRPFYAHQHPIIGATYLDNQETTSSPINAKKKHTEPDSSFKSSSHFNNSSSFDDSFTIDPKSLYVSYGMCIIFFPDPSTHTQ